MWLSYRSFTARGLECIPLLGDFGLVSQLGIADYARPRKFREKLEQWLDLIRTMWWPECRAEIDGEGRALLLSPAQAIVQEKDMPVRTIAYKQNPPTSLEYTETRESECPGQAGEGFHMPTKNLKPIWRISLKQIEQTVSAHLGPGRVPGKAPRPCFSRQVSMYLAKHVGGWSLPRNGRFYNGRHHTTVLHAVAKIERLRKKDEALDALLDILASTLNSERLPSESLRPNPISRSELVDAIASRVIERMTELPTEIGSAATIGKVMYEAWTRCAIPASDL
jgi:hypothetical protein